LNKAAIIQAIIASLHSELERYSRSARSAHAEATDEQSKAENKYDTRGLEASYLARGQSQQAQEVTRAIQEYESLELRGFRSGEPVGVGALIEIEHEGHRIRYFLGPRAGGVDIDCDGDEIIVISPQSPIGRQLVGRKQGDTLQITIGGKTTACRLLAIS
jgi:transcription elongation GreA/GreB family factor